MFHILLFLQKFVSIQETSSLLIKKQFKVRLESPISEEKDLCKGDNKNVKIYNLEAKSQNKKNSFKKLIYISHFY